MLLGAASSSLAASSVPGRSRRGEGMLGAGSAESRAALQELQLPQGTVAANAFRTLPFLAMIF